MGGVKTNKTIYWAVTRQLRSQIGTSCGHRINPATPHRASRRRSVGGQPLATGLQLRKTDDRGRSPSAALDGVKPDEAGQQDLISPCEAGALLQHAPSESRKDGGAPSGLRTIAESVVRFSTVGLSKYSFAEFYEERSEFRSRTQADHAIESDGTQANGGQEASLRGIARRSRQRARTGE